MREELLALRRKAKRRESTPARLRRCGAGGGFLFRRRPSGRGAEDAGGAAGAQPQEKRPGAPHDTLWAMNGLAVSYFYAPAAGTRRSRCRRKCWHSAARLNAARSTPEHACGDEWPGHLPTSTPAAGRRRSRCGRRRAAPSRKINGPEYPDTLGAMGNLADDYFKAGRRDEALKIREEVLAISRKTNGPEHPDTIWAMNDLANSYFDAGRRSEALKMPREEVLAAQPQDKRRGAPKHAPGDAQPGAFLRRRRPPGRSAQDAGGSATALPKGTRSGTSRHAGYAGGRFLKLIWRWPQTRHGSART